MTPRELWLAERRTGIGGSDIAAIMGKSTWATPLSVYHDKLGYKADKEETNEQRIGKALEHGVLQLYSQQFDIPDGCKIDHEPYTILRCELEPRFLASPDALVVDGESIRWGIEIKTSAHSDWTDGPPEIYILQCQWYMLVTGCKRWDLAVLQFGSKFFAVQLEADGWLQLGMVAAAYDFLRMVDEAIEPDPTTYEDVKSLYEDPNVNVRPSNADDEEVYAEYVEAKQLADAAKDRLETAKVKLCAAIGNDVGITFLDSKTITWKPNKNGVRSLKS